MEETSNSASYEEKSCKEAPQLVAILKEMKDGLDTVTSKVQGLTSKVKAKQFSTADGISYLEAKHLLLLNYCQSLVYYLLRKAKGFSIEGHPVVHSLVEIRLFLEKIRPIDKKLQYQLQKHTSATGNDMVKLDVNEREAKAAQKSEDLLKLRPNPDMLISKSDLAAEDSHGVYRPPKFVPVVMDEDRMTRLERNALRKEEEAVRQAKNNDFMRSLMDDLEGRPEEIRETVGVESRELIRYRQKMEDQARREEELFTRASITAAEKKKMKHLMKSRNGLLGLTESFYDEIKTLPLGDFEEQTTVDGYGNDFGKKHKKLKRKR
ncbi:hypothetical protein Nepgr_008911 [Nepenthes gracilis]|uniref:Neuroguidin n=1 Tax=Nepenthes gracilis TaxID=150966 RepID=A0AAD3SAG1_NEPGR|nr:hypothetical protein Nepgr_008911 [Nepenthes gracilis]